MEAKKQARFYKDDELITYKNGHQCILHEVRADGWVVGWPNGEYTKGENPADFTRGWAK